MMKDACTFFLQLLVFFACISFPECVNKLTFFFFIRQKLHILYKSYICILFLFSFFGTNWIERFLLDVSIRFSSLIFRVSFVEIILHDKAPPIPLLRHPHEIVIVSSTKVRNFEKNRVAMSILRKFREKL